jgi:hypothetical protein
MRADLRLAWLLALLLALAALLPAGVLAGEGEETPAWRLVEVIPPEAPGGGGAPGSLPLGAVGDIEFWAPNRGALITAGNPPSVPPGVWEYDGKAWHELSTVCGASDGRIAWAGPEEFWTISDGRPGQALIEGKRPPTTDNTLCRFSNANHAGEPLRVVQSFAFPAFQADSYQPMHAAACLSPGDCWFAGEQLPESSTEDGSFHLHWDGSALTELPYPIEGHAVRAMVPFQGRLYESVQLSSGDRVERKLPEPPVLHAINPEGAGGPIFEGMTEIPLYGGEALPSSFGFFHLGAGEELLWLAGGPVAAGEHASAAQVTIARGNNFSGRQGSWEAVIGAGTGLEGAFPEETPTAIAAEPGSDTAWVALDDVHDAAHPARSATAHLIHVRSEGAEPIVDEATLPEGADAELGPTGAGARLACPAPSDCWMATTQGFLYHYSTAAEEQIGQDPDPAFQTLITERPEDEGLPKTPSDAIPTDNSGEEPPPPPSGDTKPEHGKLTKTLPLLKHLRSRIVHGDTLQLLFHLTVKAQMRLIARRNHAVVAATPMRTLKAGNRMLELRLDPKRWPTKLQLKTHALAKLPVVPVGSGNDEGVVSTSLAFPPIRDIREFGPVL